MCETNALSGMNITAQGIYRSGWLLLPKKRYFRFIRKHCRVWEKQPDLSVYN